MTTKYVKRFYDDDGFEVIVLQCLNCEGLIYIGDDCEENYCTSCGEEII